MEITIPIYILCSIANIIVWRCAYKMYKKCNEKREARYSTVATYDPDENIPLVQYPEV